MSDKAPEAFRTISEVASILDTPPHVLRFWESKFAQLKPVKRAGGRRYYRPGDLMLLGGIKRLLHDDGMTIRGVQKILRTQGVRHVANLAPAAVLAATGEAAETAQPARWPAESPDARPEDLSGEGPPQPDLFGAQDTAAEAALLPETLDAVPEHLLMSDAPESAEDGRRLATRLRDLDGPLSAAQAATAHRLRERLAALHDRLVRAAAAEPG